MKFQDSLELCFILYYTAEPSILLHLCFFFLLQLLVRVQDGATPPLEAFTQVTVNIRRNFFTPELGIGQSADVSEQVLEITTPGTEVTRLLVIDNDRRVSKTAMVASDSNSQKYVLQPLA